MTERQLDTEKVQAALKRAAARATTGNRDVRAGRFVGKPRASQIGKQSRKKGSKKPGK